MKQASPARKKALLVKALVAVVGSAGSVLVLLKAPAWGVCIFLSVVAALAAYEFTTATRFVTHRYLVVLSVLHAVGVIWAAALMRPSRSVQDMEVKSLKKKFKDKKFAAGCSRDVIAAGAERLGWTLEELMERTLAAMRQSESDVERELAELTK